MNKLMASILFVSFCFGSPGQTLQVEQDALFAVVTRKAGLAAKLAHNHLVVSKATQVVFQWDSRDPLMTRFRCEIDASKLEIDRSSDHEAWYLRLNQLGVLNQKFEEISDSNRKKITKSMFSKKQLNIDAHKTIKASVTDVRAKKTVVGSQVFDYEIDLAFTVVGKSVTRPVAARVERYESGIHVEALGVFYFSDFGIKPYSALLGAVANQDKFLVFVDFKATYGGARDE